METSRTLRIIAVTAALSLLAVPAAGAAPGRGHPGPDRSADKAIQLAQPELLRDRSVRGRARPGTLAADPGVALAPCPEDDGWLCGTVDVPFDRAESGGRELPIAFAVLPRSNPTSTATDAVFLTDGGPGVSNVANRWFLGFLGGGLNDDRDLVVVDHRGTGQSGAIDCPKLQNLFEGVVTQEDAVRAIGACGRQLGDDADRYGSGDVAMDLEAVRAALSYDQISFYGLSYGGVFVSAYAVRYPGRLRAAILDAPTPVTDDRHEWTWGTEIPPAIAEGVGLDCRRAPACHAAQPNADTALARIADILRDRPVSGWVRVSDVGRRRVTADMEALAWLSRGNWINNGELAAAAKALGRGDRRPLLRLAAETLHLGGVGGSAPPEFDSLGNNAAVFCNDADPVWDRGDPRSTREAKYAAAYAALAAADAFAPFTAEAWTEYFWPRWCLRWPAPDRFVPAIPDGATVPAGVPALMLTGDRDTQVPTDMSRELLEVFPAAHHVEAAGAAHPAAGWSECARELFHAFVRTLTPPAADDCDEPANVVPTTSKFPEHARGAAPATPAPGDRSRPVHRKIATVVVQTVRDAWLRSFRVPGARGGLTALRGGGGSFDYRDFSGRPALIWLDQAQLARNVAVSGRTTWHLFGANGLRFIVDVDGPRGEDGWLRARGKFGFSGPYRDFRVTGELGGRHVEVTVPAN
ncbi:alpha/beta fold hydrolase [Nocardioides coralli]|uniref:alpha/beta fold hydrolase n=1 Tax=Nocardioides coralli TaxID=2872154 RepID=UPI001CA3B250|nr:alpha/beta fold hydrolase [Nocardioides coralli]QZY29717.1 alpha/beta hydrolase [Nocardioides coralli]